MHVPRAIAAPFLAGILLFAGAPLAFAAGSASLSLSPSSSSLSVGDTLTVDVKLDSGGQAVSAVEVRLTVPSGLHYASADATGSVFATEVTAPTLSGTTLRFVRATTDAGGWTGAAGQLMRLTFTATASGSQSLQFIQAQSQVIATSDNSEILGSVQNASYAVDAGSGGSGGTGTAAPTASATPSSSPTASSQQATATAASTATSLPVTGGEAASWAALLAALAVAGGAAYALLSLRERR